MGLEKCCQLGNTLKLSECVDNIIIRYGDVDKIFHFSSFSLEDAPKSCAVSKKELLKTINLIYLPSLSREVILYEKYPLES